MVTINITGRHMSVTESLRNDAYRQAEKLVRYFERIKRIEVIMDFNKGRYNVEMIISGTRGIVLVSHTTNRNCTMALDIAADKMERQLTKLKEKLRSRRARDYESQINKIIKKKTRKQLGGLEQDDWY